MADINRAASFAKNIQKRAGRAKEFFRQNLGKADKTTDEKFEEYVKNFQIQQSAAARLTKEIKNYNNCVKALQVASKSLMETLCDQYEPNWVDHDGIQVKAQILEKKWEDYHQTIEDQVVKPLMSYSEQFPDVHAKILKRRRKLMDFDCCRHTIQNLENAKKKEETKIAKANEQLIEKQNLYDTINSELMEELPALWDSRVSFLASNFQCLFLAEVGFHNGAIKIFSDMNDAVELLATATQKGIFNAKRQSGGNCAQNVSSNESYVSAQGEPMSSECISDDSTIAADSKCAAVDQGNTIKSMDEEDTPPVENTLTKIEKATDKDDNISVPIDSVETQSSEKQDDCTTTEKPILPLGVFYQVKATYQYVAEDGDELSFEPGEIINVTEFDDPEQQEEGWLMGYKEGGTIKGLFPANFTVRLDQ